MLDKLLKRPVIPVIAIDDFQDAEPLAEALLKGGIDVIEITFRTKAATKAMESISKTFPDMLLGAGTVRSKEQSRQARESGAGFALAPGLDLKVIEYFQSLGGVFIPGVMTPSEIEQGLSLGCHLLKFFPASAAGGVSMLKALAGPYANEAVKFCPTGGIHKKNMREYLDLPMVASIGGSWIARKDQIANKEWETITHQAQEALEICASTKSNM
jgi:2-dehydro-3-deoxyphosphogluconate aldolase/(4S)-4-hydroxy-2-oxoglutarate aldolase